MKCLGCGKPVLESAAEMLTPIAAHRTILGTMASPWTGWLLMRSLETLHLRMNRQAENARKVAEFHKIQGR